jgi:hypothetical protein
MTWKITISAAFLFYFFGTAASQVAFHHEIWDKTQK